MYDVHRGAIHALDAAAGLNSIGRWVSKDDAVVPITYLLENDDWPGRAKRALAADACEFWGALRFAPATLTQVGQQLVSRHFVSGTETAEIRDRGVAVQWWLKIRKLKNFSLGVIAFAAEV